MAVQTRASGKLGFDEHLYSATGWVWGFGGLGPFEADPVRTVRLRLYGLPRPRSTVFWRTSSAENVPITLESLLGG
jgi:hypothetical protein